ncbi:MAG: hypothetical protein ACRD5Z_08325, partial [Bryobacteraceae bacterium]
MRRNHFYRAFEVEDDPCLSRDNFRQTNLLDPLVVDGYGLHPGMARGRRVQAVQIEIHPRRIR